MTGPIEDRNIFTIHQLNQIKPGNVVVYYRGNFNVDIVRSEKDKNISYAMILKAVHAHAKRLEKSGKVHLLRKEFKTTSAVKNVADAFRMYEYVAVGRGVAGVAP